MRESYPMIAVRAQIGRYVLGEISLRQLEDWLFPLVWTEDGEPDAVGLAWDAQLLLMEASGGYHTEEELRARLVPLAVIPMGDPSFFETSTSSVTVTREALLPARPVGEPLAVEFVS